MKEIPTDRPVTYQLQYRKCGKAGCSTCRTYGHGPYWYARWWEPLRKGHVQDVAYIGKELPPGIQSPPGAREFTIMPEDPAQS